jgi:hypothetical protein
MMHSPLKSVHEYAAELLEACNQDKDDALVEFMRLVKKGLPGVAASWCAEVVVVLVRGDGDGA